MNAEEIKLRALEITKGELEYKLRHAERHAEAVMSAKLAEAKRKLLSKRFNDASAKEESKQRLLEIPCDAWLPALTGVQMPRYRKVRCPLPGHEEERTASCHFWETRFRCFGCGRGGDIFVFAEYLWGIPCAGPRFPELRERLAERLL
jgi:hypothetical protein